MDLKIWVYCFHNYSQTFLILLLVYGRLPLIIHGLAALCVLQVLGEAIQGAVSPLGP